VQRVAPAGRKTSKSASEKIKYRRHALRAMLPIKMVYSTEDLVLIKVLRQEKGYDN